MVGQEHLQFFTSRRANTGRIHAALLRHIDNGASESTGVLREIATILKIGRAAPALLAFDSMGRGRSVR